MQKVRSRSYKELLLLVDLRFQILFHSPLGVLFTFPSRYLFTIGRLGIFSLGTWSSQIPTGFLVSCGTQVPLSSFHRFRLLGYHHLWQSFPQLSASFYFDLTRGPTTLIKSP